MACRGCRHGSRMEWSCGKLEKFGGAVAQLGARLDGIEEVVGSNPIGSTNFQQIRRGSHKFMKVEVCPLSICWAHRSHIGRWLEEFEERGVGEDGHKRSDECGVVEVAGNEAGV